MTADRDLRPDPEMEGRVNSWLTDTDLTPGEADHGLERVFDEFPTTPQTRRRFLGRWFERDEGARRRTDEHDHPPDTRRTRLMFSATGLVAAFAILALAVNVLPTTDTSPPNAGSGTTLSVAADGSGDFGTISEAVAAAADGDTIMVKPGTYAEAIRIDKDIMLMGDGPREEIVIASLAGPLIDLDGSNATLSGFTFNSRTTYVNVSGGAPTLENLWFSGVGIPYSGGASVGNSLVITGASSALVRDNLFTDGGDLQVTGNSAPLIEDNELRDGPGILMDQAASATVVRDNTVVDNLRRAIVISGDGRPLIEGNTFDGSKSHAVRLGSGDAAGVDPILRDNVITGAPIGVIIGRGAAPAFEGNQIDVEGSAINFEGASEAVFNDNTICGAEAIVTTWSEGAPGPSLDGNDVCEVATAQ